MHICAFTRPFCLGADVPLYLMDGIKTRDKARLVAPRSTDNVWYGDGGISLTPKDVAITYGSHHRQLYAHTWPRRPASFIDRTLHDWVPQCGHPS